MAFVFVLMMFDASVPPPEIASVVAPDTDTETAKAEIAVLSFAVGALLKFRREKRAAIQV